MIYRRQYPRRLGPMIATQPAQRVTPRSLSARPPVDPEPSVSPEPARTPVVGSPRPCPVCGETIICAPARRAAAASFVLRTLPAATMTSSFA